MPPTRAALLLLSLALPAAALAAPLERAAAPELARVAPVAAPLAPSAISLPSAGVLRGAALPVRIAAPSVPVSPAIAGYPQTVRAHSLWTSPGIAPAAAAPATAAAAAQAELSAATGKGGPADLPAIHTVLPGENHVDNNAPFSGGAQKRTVIAHMHAIAARLAPRAADAGVAGAETAGAQRLAAETAAAATGAEGSNAAPPAPPGPPAPKQPWHKRPGFQILASVVGAAAFNVGLYAHSGAQAAQEFLSTYLIEWTMSLDNVVVLSTAILAAPAGKRGKVMRWALLGTIAARMVMITAGVGLVAAHAALFYAFGAFLLATAVKMLKPEWDLVGALLKPVGALFRRGKAAAPGAGARPSRRWLSPTLKVGLAVVGINVVFALDSVPAALAISKSAFVIIAANAFSLVGLNAVVVFLDALQKRFALLPKGVAAVLVFVGGKMILEPLLHVSLGALVSTGVIVALLGGSALLSLARRR